MNNITLEQIEAIVRQAAQLMVRSGFEVHDKGTRENLVTSSDLAVQDFLTQKLAGLLPGSGFLCEEEDLSDIAGHEYVWVIDPIDGTLNYNRGVPVFGTQMALMVDKQPVFSIVSLPALGEVYMADRENGATMNGIPLKQSGDRPLRECIVSTGDFSRKKVFWREKHEELIGRMRDEVARIRMFGAACADFAFLASGKTDIHLRFVNKLWDFVPGMFIAEMSGAYYDRDLLESTRLLVMCGSENESREFAGKVLDGMVLRE